MRAGLNTIQQTLTAEAAAVLTQSIAEAARRGHGQTTPLHVAATLLADPSGLLRHACIRSHPHSSHPLQCRALELCFSVALDRLPSSNPNPSSCSPPPPPPPPPAASHLKPHGSSSAVAEPPISNALMAALKRAQAHQRRGCPESQQQPLLAVKVELEQLVVSILDDPSVSRVMREASFSSTAVKATIEQSLSSSSSSAAAATAAPEPSPAGAAGGHPSPGSLGPGLNLVHRMPARNLYINPRLHQQQSNSGAAALAGGGGRDPHSAEEVKRVTDILLRSKKRNPVLVGDSDPDALMRRVVKRIEAGDLPPPLRAAKVVSLEKEFAAAADLSQIPVKIRELGSLAGAEVGDGGVVIDLGDLKWLVESPAGMGASPGQSGPIQPQPIVSEVGKAAVAEMGKLLSKFGDGGRHVWLVGTATCATYLRCQVYHPTMEKDWDLQAVPIARRLPLAATFPRLGSNGILSSSVETLSPMKGFTAMGATAIPLRRPQESTDPPRRTTLCPSCMESYEQELGKLVANEFEKSSPKPEREQVLPPWLQIAKLGNGGGGGNSSTERLLQSNKDQELLWKQSSDELLKRWRDTCSRLHPSSHSVLLGSEGPLPSSLSMPSCMLAPRRSSEPKLAIARSLSPLQLSSNQGPVEQPRSPPASPVRTDLVLGLSKGSDSSAVGEIHEVRVKDSPDCVPDEYSDVRQRAKVAGASDIDSFKRLFTGLSEKVSWQPEAASAVATVVTQCRSGRGKQRRLAPKGDTWLLFIGPDRVGKRKMAAALSELVFGAAPVAVSFSGSSHVDGNGNGSEHSTVCTRGKTALDRVVEAVRRNPFAVVLLEDIDRADGLARGTLKRAIESGRLPDSHGREVSLGSAIFVLTSDWLPEELKNESSRCGEEKILDWASCEWHLELSIEDSDKPGKRRADWPPCGRDETAKEARKELSLDLNLAAGSEDDTREGSRNSSDLTVEHEQEKGRLDVRCSTPCPAAELMEFVDDSVVFKPVDLRPLRRKVLESLSAKFDAVMGRDRRSLRVDEDALDRLVGGLCLAGASTGRRFAEWTETVLGPSIERFKGNPTVDNAAKIVRLRVGKGGAGPRTDGGDWLPPTVAIAVDGL